MGLGRYIRAALSSHESPGRYLRSTMHLNLEYFLAAGLVDVNVGALQGLTSLFPG